MQSQEITILDFLNQLERDHDISFSYSSESWLQDKMTTIPQSTDLVPALEYLTNQHDIKFKVVDRSILLRKLQVTEPESGRFRCHTRF